jgi:hypothetical protein
MAAQILSSTNSISISLDEDEVLDTEQIYDERSGAIITRLVIPIKTTAGTVEASTTGVVDWDAADLTYRADPINLRRFVRVNGDEGVVTFVIV